MVKNNWVFRIDSKIIWTNLGFRPLRCFHFFPQYFWIPGDEAFGTPECLLRTCFGVQTPAQKAFGGLGLKGFWSQTETTTEMFVGWFGPSTLRCSFFFLYSLLAAHGIALMLGCVPRLFLWGQGFVMFLMGPNFSFGIHEKETRAQNVPSFPTKIGSGLCMMNNLAGSMHPRFQSWTSTGCMTFKVFLLHFSLDLGTLGVNRPKLLLPGFERFFFGDRGVRIFPVFVREMILWLQHVACAWTQTQVKRWSSAVTTMI